MKILAIETSCDETAAGVVEDGVRVLSTVVASSVAMHEKYGGIVPEVVAREQLRCVIPVITEALKHAHADYASIDSLAVTIGPGLIGSLLVGVETAKTIAFVTHKPIIPVNHVIAHMYANFIRSSEKNSSRAKSRDYIHFPAISLVVSGGHTELYLMTSPKNILWLGGTLDDAAGEAFDKTARILGFGSRGGVAIQEAAFKSKTPASPAGRQNPNDKFQIKLPRPMIHDKSLNFSFSGLKTAIIREWKRYPQHNEPLVNSFAHEVQEAITDVLVTKTLRAAHQYRVKSVLLSGGVAANLRLREKFQQSIAHSQLPTNFFVPPVSLCTDNAVSIASNAYFNGKPAHWRTITAIPNLDVEQGI